MLRREELDNLERRIKDAKLVQLNPMGKLFVLLSATHLLTLLEQYSESKVTEGVDTVPPSTEDLADYLQVRFVLVVDRELVGEDNFRILQDVEI